MENICPKPALTERQLQLENISTKPALPER